jgi:hypothetical protein
MKIFIIFLVAVVLGASLLGDTSKKAVTASNVSHKSSDVTANNPSIDFMVGNWSGTGFVTDVNGLQQYVEIQENNQKISEDEYQIVGNGKNPANGYMYSYNKLIFYNAPMNAWYVKGKINENVLHDSRITIGENFVFSYSYYDVNSVLVRHITIREGEDIFTETKEKWGQNGWDKTDWMRMTRIPNNVNKPFNK